MKRTRVMIFRVQTETFLGTPTIAHFFVDENLSTSRKIEIDSYLGQKRVKAFEKEDISDGNLNTDISSVCVIEPTKKQLIARPTSLSLKTSVQMNADSAVHDVTASLDEGFCLLSCQEKICDLYMHLHKPGSEEVLNIFGSIILSFIDDIKQIMAEKKHLETLYSKVKDQHCNQVRLLEEEIKSQALITEQIIKKENEEALQTERKKLIIRHNQEMAIMKLEIKKLKESDVSAKFNVERVEKLVEELQRMKKENDDLKHTVVELNDNLIFVKGEMNNFHRRLEEKEVELMRQKKMTLEDSLEIDNLMSQVNLLQTTNKILHDKTDDLCEALKICRSYYKTQIKQKSFITKDDFIQKYLDESCLSISRSLSREPQTFEIKSIKTTSSGFGDNEADDLESCQSNMEDTGEVENINSISDYNSSLEKRSENCSINESNREPERVFKIVLAGDAAVGKSSFILRLCKDKFVTSLNSTVGVDFQTKTLKVDGKIIALQLWDTAGQERFRSIAKSYFRRADGVLLLYDVSYERSFISVRDWIQVIQDGAQKPVPVMIVGNKSDLRDDAQFRNACLKFEDGLHLAKSVEGLFVETSAKNGNNIIQAITELSRTLMAREDFEVRSVGLNGLKLNETEVKRIHFCC